MLALAMMSTILPVHGQGDAAHAALNRLVFGCHVAADTLKQRGACV